MSRVPDSPAVRNVPRSFNFTTHIRWLCNDITTRYPAMFHIDMQRVAITFCQTRKRVAHGLFASLTPMRFENGDLFSMRRGERYTCQRLYDKSGSEYLYILSFYLPRFLNCPFKEKLITIFHELWHVSPEFNGDIRRHSGRCHVHTRSQKQYDVHMERMVDQWLALQPPEHLMNFLRCNFWQLNKLHGSIVGTKISHPKLILVAD